MGQNVKATKSKQQSTDSKQSTINDSKAATIWTAEKIAQLMRLDKEGKTGSEIGEIMGMTRSAVRGKIAREKAKLPRGKHGKVAKPPTATRSPLKGLSELGADKCRWPLEDRFCGCDRLQGAVWPYCESHLIAARRKHQ